MRKSVYYARRSICAGQVTIQAGLSPITFPDSTSRCVTGAGLFSQATSENTVIVLRQAIEKFGTPTTIQSDNGSCFVGVRKGNPEFVETYCV